MLRPSATLPPSSPALTTTTSSASAPSSLTSTSQSSSSPLSPTMSSSSSISNSPPATPSSPTTRRGFLAAFTEPFRGHSRPPNALKTASDDSPTIPSAASPTLSVPASSPTSSNPLPSPSPIPIPSRNRSDATTSTLASSSLSRSASPPGTEPMERVGSSSSERSPSWLSSTERSEWERITCGRHSTDWIFGGHTLRGGVKSLLKRNSDSDPE